MLENRSQVLGERMTEQILLDNEQQYKIAASSALLEMMARISKARTQGDIKHATQSDQEVIIDMGILAVHTPTRIEGYLRDKHQVSKRPSGGDGRGGPPETSAAYRIGTSLQIVGDNLRLTDRFAIAVGFSARKKEASWGDMYDLNDMERLSSAKGDVLKYFTPKLTSLTNDGATTAMELREFLREAEFWIGHYDPRRQ